MERATLSENLRHEPSLLPVTPFRSRGYFKTIETRHAREWHLPTSSELPILQADEELRLISDTSSELAYTVLKNARGPIPSGVDRCRATFSYQFQLL